MSDSKTKSNAFLPLSPMPPSDDEAKKSQIDPSSGSASKRNISPVPTHKSIRSTYGKLLTPATGRMTPTGQGRVKAPPICLDLSLKKVASNMDDFNAAGVCFSQGEADKCAKKALMLNGEVSDDSLEEMPLNLTAMSTDGKPFISSNSTVITTSSAGSCGRSAMGNEIAFVASLMVKKDPPLEVVRTNMVVNNSEDEHSGATTSKAQPPPKAMDDTVTKTTATKKLQPAVSPKKKSSTSSVTTAFRDKLIKVNASRQGRSRQRWLVHSSTEELVRQVAGTIPITRDGRIILASASRKKEWILPKGGWDADETKEECAARETFEEAGLLGRLGGCLEPVDYETNKSRKRRMSKLPNSGMKGCVSEAKKSKREDEGLRPPMSKSAETDNLMASISTSSETTSGETSSLTPASQKSLDPKNHSYVRLFLFPLYVSSVKADWPEKGRLRKMVDIDEAINIMESENRLYFKRGLEIVKERGLHLLKP
mmetsp:Transcript_35029/g.64365  ORF Transcript_35029/g.64365 Transcript_35029/m.64365 type:complete len:482 (+) Transcript_35029:241-1686(+)|eukprot:CAMPEP_0201644620 /NCGR_PEP_ID=MMETSP0493-20130528/30590_1 /ASSEMBLY_ACC=CAM_ASM_000838 /TAXON_ID=420259 /ORGANISM="Thalassiosira gravida, Strain GMp14c1" /LENGTH=481 /DNA_ID=CAMNT_0048119369 /DNA_START=121 /DNA_END=1566 /DNA_ORIENTATION=-